MVEGTGLENRHTGEPGIESSNLSLSVLIRVCASGENCKRKTTSRRQPKAGSHELKGRVAEWFKAHAWKVCVR